MLDILDLLSMRSLAAEQLSQPLLPFGQRQRAKILAALEQQIEDEVDQVPRAPFRQRRLQRGEVRSAVVVERNDLAVDDAVGQPAARFGNGGKLRQSSRDPCACA